MGALERPSREAEAALCQLLLLSESLWSLRTPCWLSRVPDQSGEMESHGLPTTEEWMVEDGSLSRGRDKLKVGKWS